MFTILSFETDPITPLVHVIFSYDFYGELKTHSTLLRSAELAEHCIISEKRSYILGKTERYLRNCEKVNGMNQANRWTVNKTESINKLFSQLRDWYDYNYSLIEICREIKSMENLFLRVLPAFSTIQYSPLECYLSDIFTFINKEIKFTGQSQKSQVISPTT